MSSANSDKNTAVLDSSSAPFENICAKTPPDADPAALGHGDGAVMEGVFDLAEARIGP
jgi:hypothetical protein